MKSYVILYLSVVFLHIKRGVYMNIAICDDDIRIIESLKGLIEEYFSEKNIPFSLSCFSDGKELINTDEIFDLVIADIEMPE